MKQNRKGIFKLLSKLLVLVIVMAAPIGITQAYALEDLPLTTVLTAAELEAALGSVADGGLITLGANIDYSKGINIDGKSFTLDLQNYTLNVRNTAGAGLKIRECNLTVENGTLNVEGKTGVEAYNGKVTVNNATGTERYGALAQVGGQVTVTGRAEGITMGAYATGVGSRVDADSAVATASGGAAVFAEFGGIVTVSDSAYASNGYGVYCLGGSWDATSAIIGGNVTGKDQAVYLYGKGTVKIGGDVFTTGGSGTAVQVDFDSGVAGTVTIDGAVSASDDHYMQFSSQYQPKSAGVSDPGKSGYLKYASTDAGFTGGTVWVKGSLPAGDKVCEINGTQYATLDEALAAVKSGETIKLTGNIIYTKGIIIKNKAVTLDTNSYTLDVKAETGDGLDVSDAGHVNVIGSGSLNINGVDNGIYVTGNGTFTAGSAVTCTVKCKNQYYYNDDRLGNGVYVSGDSQASLSGNVTGAMTGIHTDGSGTIMIKGDVEAAVNHLSTQGVYARGGTVTVEGNVKAQYGLGVYCVATGDVSVTGDVTGYNRGAIASGISGTSDCTIIIGGNLKVMDTAQGKGAIFTGCGTITVEGEIIAPIYISYPTVNYSKGDTVPSDKPGYRMYQMPDYSGIVYVKDLIATVTGVTVNPSSVSVQKGAKQQFAAMVNGTNSPSQSVTWSVDGNNSAGTTISSGLLIVGSDETAVTLTVRATSIADNTKAGTAIVTVTATSQSTGGGGGGGSYTPSTPIITIDKKTDQPTVASMKLTATVDKSGNSTADITEAQVKALIDAAKKDAESKGKTADGIGVALNIQFGTDGKSINMKLDEKVLALLEKEGVKRFAVNTSLVSFSFDKTTIQEMRSQASGTVTIAANPVTGLSDAAKALIGNRPVYDLTVSYQKNGKTAYITNFGKGAVTLGIAYKAASGENTENLFGVYVDKNGKPLLLTKSSYDSGKVVFDRSSLSTYGVGYQASATDFTDTASHWAKDNIDFVVSRGLLSGTGATTFSPNTAITRADFLMALGKLSGTDVSGYKTSSFTDVSGASLAMPYIEWAVENKIVLGVGEGRFSPDSQITREQMSVMMVNYAKAAGNKLPVSQQAIVFTDDIKISLWAKESVKAIQQTGVINGKNNKLFDPAGNATRAEAATILRRFVELVIDESTVRD